jgi:hypothetical protein
MTTEDRYAREIALWVSRARTARAAGNRPAGALCMKHARAVHQARQAALDALEADREYDRSKARGRLLESDIARLQQMELRMNRVLGYER